MRNTALIVVNSLLFIAFATQLVSGFFLRSLSIFRQIHLNLPPFLAILVILHLVLNWWWVKQRIFTKDKKDGKKDPQ